MIIRKNKSFHGNSLLNTHLKVGPWPRPALWNNIYIGPAAGHLVVRVKYAMFFISFNNFLKCNFRQTQAFTPNHDLNARQYFKRPQTNILVAFTSKPY